MGPNPGRLQPEPPLRQGKAGWRLKGAVTERSRHEAWWDRKNRRDSLRRRHAHAPCCQLCSVYRILGMDALTFAYVGGSEDASDAWPQGVFLCRWEWPENSWLVIWQALRQRG